MSGSDNGPLFIELEFEQSGHEILMHLNKSPLGQQLHGQFRLPFSSDELSAKLEAIECRRLSTDELEIFGQQLYQAMAQTHIGQAIRKALGLAYQHRGTQAILQLRFDGHAIDLLSIPWELLHDGRRYLVGNGIELTRYIDYPEALSPLVVTPPLRVLQVVASPTDWPPLDVHQSIEALDSVDNIVVERLPQPTYRAMRKQLRTKRYHVLHFDGHGMVKDGQNVLYFQDKRGKSVAVSVPALQRALGNQVDLVVLNACQGAKIAGSTVFNSLAPALIAVGIPAVVGMQFSILDKSAALFIEGFYEAVAKLEPLTQAMADARGELDLSEEWYIPTLYLRSSDPIGQLFAPTEAPPIAKPEPAHPKEEAAPQVKEPARQPEPEPLPEPSPQVVPPDEPPFFSDAELARLPHPIAAACARINAAQTDRERFVALDWLTNNLVKYLTAIALSHYWQDEPDKDQLRTWLGKLSQRRLMTYWIVFNEISVHYLAAQQKPHLFPVLFRPYNTAIENASPVATAYRTLRELQPQQAAQAEEITCETFLRKLLTLRQTKWEGDVAQAEVAIQETLLSVLCSALQDLLSRFQLLFDYPLHYIQRVDQDGSDWVYTTSKFLGPEGKVSSIPLREQNVPQPTSRANRLYLCTPEGSPHLNLHPFFIQHAGKLYFLEQAAERDEIWYQHCASAERYQPPAYLGSLIPSWLKTKEEAQEVDDPVAQLEQANEELAKEENQKRKGKLSWPTLMKKHLSDEGRQALEIALGEALRIGRFWLGIEFLLMALSKQNGCAFPTALHQMGLSRGKVRGALRGMVGVVTQEDWRQKKVATLGAKALPLVKVAKADDLPANFKANAEQPPVITPRMFTILQEAAKLAGEGQVGHKHLLGAALRHYHSLPMQLLFMEASQVGFSPGQVLAHLAQSVGLKPEALLGDAPKSPSQQKPPHVHLPPRPRGPSILAKFGRDLIHEAQAGKLHPAEGESARQAMTQLGRILIKQEANNPLLIGEPGVGKTAIVEGFAWRLAGQGKGVVKQLANKRVVEVTTAALLSGTKYRGDLEERLEQLLAEVKAEQGQTIIFIDEIHSILGGGSSGGLSTIADAIKPALARAEFPCIGATTVAEYRRHIEKDKALARRFTPVWLEEPTLSEAVQIVKKVAQGRLSKHHGVQFARGTIEAAVSLSARYLHSERLPGKAIKVLDEACARQVMPQSLSGGPQDEETTVGGIVDVQAVQKVIAQRTNIPFERLSQTDKQRLLKLSGKLKERIIGQDQAIAQVTRVLKRAGAGLASPRRPMGVFLFAGPTGVGKTELALALAEALFGHQDAIFRLDMSEFMEKHQVARLIGAPPGYIGHQNEGQLTAHLRRHPYSVVLLDEIEKAHQDVQHLFLQLFDDGRLTDAQGREAFGRSAIFIMTTNLGTKKEVGLAPTPYPNQLQAAITKHFTPEFRNRIDRIIYFNQLNQQALIAIFDREFARVQKRLDQQGYPLPEIPPAIKEQIAANVQQQKLGARPLRRLIEDKIVAPLVDKLLQGGVQPGDQIALDLAFDAEPDKPDSPIGSPLPQIKPFQPGQGRLQGLGPFRLPNPIGPQRPISPADGLPHLDNLDDEHQAPFDKRFLALAEQLQAQAIALSITEQAKIFLCLPVYAEQRGNRSPEQAFDELIDEPLNDKLLADQFQNGDWIRIESKSDKIIFEKVEEANP